MIHTALPAEYKAVRVHLKRLRQEVCDARAVYEVGVFQSPLGDWEVAIAQIGVGTPSAAAAVERAVNHFQPTVVFLVGIAGGLKDVQHGDVVAATKIYGYESGKDSEEFHPRPEIGRSSFALEQRSRYEAKFSAWRRRIRGRSSRAPVPSVYVGPIASGDKVLTSQRSIDFFKKHYSDALAVEMEASGFMEALRAHPNVDALVIRGISDLITDKRRADRQNYQDLAATRAAAFAFQVLANLYEQSDPETALHRTQRFRPRKQNTVEGRRFLPLLARLCERTGLYSAEMTERLAGWVQQQVGSKWEKLARDLVIRKSFNEIETIFQASDVREVVDLFGIHPVLLDPIFSGISPEAVVTVSLDTDLVPVGRDGDPFYGIKCQYCIPQERLEGADAAFAHVQIEPGGRSDIHEHPGDEFAYVLSGESEIRFENTGLRNRLRPGDYIHFYADQTHSYWNVSTLPCRLLVVRFYQLVTRGTRQQVLAELESESYLAWAKTPVARDWIRQMRALPPGIVEDPRRISDSVGLGRFLERLRVEYFPGCQSPSDMTAIARELKSKRIITRELDIQRLEEGLEQLDRDDLKDLSRAYKVQPMLFYRWLFPSVPGVVTIRADDDRGEHEVPDLERVSSDFVRSRGVEYWAPRRNLALSDIAINVVTLDPEAETPLNRHPGYELILPSYGTVAVGLVGIGKEFLARAARHQYAHFPSHIEHSVRNVGAEPARCLVIRFHGAPSRHASS
jgi:nucleoside phosphorylase/quercetin dioxygenase-like cupin family protein